MKRRMWYWLMFMAALAYLHPLAAFAAEAVAAAPSAIQDVAGKVLDFSQVTITGTGGQSVLLFTALEDMLMPFLTGPLAVARPFVPLAISFVIWLAGGIHAGASWWTILTGSASTALGSMLVHRVQDKLGAGGALLGLAVSALSKGSFGTPGPISSDTYKAMALKGQNVSAWNPDGSVKALPTAIPKEVPIG